MIRSNILKSREILVGPIERQIRKKERSRIGDNTRKSRQQVIRQALTWNFRAKRKRGRSRNTWRRDLDTDIARARLQYLEAHAQNRVRWRSVVDGLCSATGSLGLRKSKRFSPSTKHSQS